MLAKVRSVRLYRYVHQVQHVPINVARGFQREEKRVFTCLPGFRECFHCTRNWHYLLQSRLFWYLAAVFNWTKIGPFGKCGRRNNPDNFYTVSYAMICNKEDCAGCYYFFFNKHYRTSFSEMNISISTKSLSSINKTDSVITWLRKR